MNKKIFVSIVLLFSIPSYLYAGVLNNLDITISPDGNVPAVTIPCVTGHDYTSTLVHRSGDVVSYSFGVVERKFCGDNSQVTFPGYNINQPYSFSWTPVDWNYVRTPLEYIIKDSTGLGLCYSETACSLINLVGAFNSYDSSVYLASSTYWTTVGDGPIFDSEDKINWTNIGNVNISTTTDIATGTAVMFFPGVMGSRLYENVNGSDQQDWVTTSDSNQAGLVLDNNGKSVKQIYTKDDTQSLNDEAETGIVDEATAGVNIYNSFIDDLRDWKEQKVITDYAFIPYDWRLSLDDIITKGATTTAGNLSYTNSQNFSDSFILKKLNELSQKSAHITLIGHSNGGLVIKALVQKLKDTNNPLYYRIDKIIFVAVPQVGTPDAIATLLHGSSLGGGLVMENQRSRQLSENMPVAYNLLPSASYFSSVDQKFPDDTVVTFENSANYGTQISQYGTDVTNPTELKNYVLGSDGRTKPGYDDTDNPSIGNSVLYTQAQTVHNILDSWQPASTTKVIQVAGWGEETLSGIRYKTCSSYFGLGSKYNCFSIKTIIDGDGTVVVPSALWMSTSTPSVERWWVNLGEYNKGSPGIIRTKHKDILEIEKLNNFIKSKLSNTVFTDSVIVNNSSTLTSSETRLHYTLHSPLTLGVVDFQGRYSGLDPVTKQVREEIPNVTYRTIGDTQFISVPSDLVGQVKLIGHTDGVFALDVEKQLGDNVTASVSFQAVPTSTSTQVVLDINNTVASSTLNIDQNGDGKVDKVLKSINGENVLYDNTPPEISISFSTSTREVIFGAIDNSPVILNLSNSSTTATDSQGNKTSLVYNKYKDKPTKLTLAFNTIVRIGVSTTTPNTRIEYNWAEKNKILTDLDTSVIIKNVERFVFNYKKSTNITTIKEKTKNGVNTTTRNGFVVVTVKTNADGVDVSY